jgi:Trk K+ transport system NAD-binding subunit
MVRGLPDGPRRCGSVCLVHVVIMGCGRVGSTLARDLEDRNHTVSVIDTNPDAFRRLGPPSVVAR